MECSHGQWRVDWIELSYEGPSPSCTVLYSIHALIFTVTVSQRQVQTVQFGVGVRFELHKWVD
jgi:hypothetical protein